MDHGFYISYYKDLPFVPGFPFGFVFNVTILRCILSGVTVTVLTVSSEKGFFHNIDYLHLLVK